MSGVLANQSQVAGQLKQFWWVAIAILLVLVIGSNYPKFGGWLIIMLTMGMVYSGQKYL